MILNSRDGTLLLLCLKKLLPVIRGYGVRLSSMRFLLWIKP